MCDPHGRLCLPHLPWPLSSETFYPSKQYNLLLIPIIPRSDVERDLFERSHYPAIAHVRIKVETPHPFPEMHRNSMLNAQCISQFFCCLNDAQESVVGRVACPVPHEPRPSKVPIPFISACIENTHVYCFPFATSLSAGAHPSSIHLLPLKICGFSLPDSLPTL